MANNNYAAALVTPPANLPADLYPDQRPILYVANAASSNAVAKLDEYVGDGKPDKTPGRPGWTARRLSAAEVQAIVDGGRDALKKYRAVWTTDRGGESDMLSF